MTKRPILLARVFTIVVFVAMAWVWTDAQRVPSAGGSFLPSADYDLSGDVRFTNTSLNNSQNPVTVGGTQTLTGKSFTSPTISGTVAGGATYTSPVFTTPTLGVALATSINGNIFTVGSSTYTGTAGQTYTFPTTSATIARTDAANTFTGVQTMTAPVISGFTSYANTGTITNPTATGGIPVMLFCGSTGVGNQTCSATAAAATTKIYSGHSTLSSNAAVITFPVAFASTTYDCVANDITTRANPVQMISTSNNTATITNTTGGSDVINWHCIGQ